jgi:phospholipid/cholesterol/gamma-HCH transport system permease protein
MKVFEPNPLPPPTNVLQSVGREVIGRIRGVGVALLISFEALLYFYRLPFRRAEFGRQLMNAGVKCFLVTSIVAFFTGMILALQTGLALQDWSQEELVGNIVVQTMCREMGPFMTALILAAAIGSAYAAEIGTMKVSEEVSALELMSINPVEFLITPRIFALIIMAPILTIYTDILGTLGGMLVSQTQLGVYHEVYYSMAIESLQNKEIYVGLLKSVIFGFIIGTVCSYRGFSTENGAVGVGAAARQTVVTSFLYILIVGYFVTRVFY